MLVQRKKVVDQTTEGVELYIDFFELMSPNLLKFVEESRIKGSTTGAINASFMALISKKSHLDFFPGLLSYVSL